MSFKNIKSVIVLLSIFGLYSCAKNQLVTPENFYFKTVTINGVQSGGFYANGIGLRPVVDFSFSVPIDKATASRHISLFEKGTSETPDLEISFKNKDSIVSVTPKTNLKGITEYNLVVSGLLCSSKQNKLLQPIKLGITTGLDTSDKYPRISDEQLLDLVQRQTLKYFWDFAHPVSGLARERNTSGDICTSGGTGFGIMALCVGAERRFLEREDVYFRLIKMTEFLLNKAEVHHGAFSHWLNGETGKTVPFSTFDNGGDLVETSYLIQGLITARQYFDQPSEKALRDNINKIWERVEWSWYTRGEDNLYWHWSPNYEWKMNMPIRGWNECLITYFLAAASPTYPINKTVYENCWVNSNYFNNGKTFYGVKLPLGFDYGGPLFFSHYSFLGLDPRNLTDKYANYWEQNMAHTKINYLYCVNNPKYFPAYGLDCWGLTASDSYNGYAAHSPTEDLGVISPTAAISAMPYMPQESMKALRFFYYKLGDQLWKNHGFVDAFDLSHKWFAGSFLAIDQGPIVIMIENYRSGLLWKKFMAAPEVKVAKGTLGFK